MSPHTPYAQQTPLKSYLWGFLLSLVLTLTAYFLVTEQPFTGDLLLTAVVGLGMLQVIVQLALFLHFGGTEKPHWNYLVLFFMVCVAALIIGGSIWIVLNLNARVMP